MEYKQILKLSPLKQDGPCWSGWIGKLHISYLESYKRLDIDDKDYPHSRKLCLYNITSDQVDRLILILEYNGQSIQTIQE